jgi:hypothetical protein
VLAARHDLPDQPPGQSVVASCGTRKSLPVSGFSGEGLVHALGRQPDRCPPQAREVPGGRAYPGRPDMRLVREPKDSSLTRGRRPGRVGRSVRLGNGPGWHCGHHQVSREYGVPVTLSRNATGVRQRRQGRSARPYTQWVAPRRVSRW